MNFEISINLLEMLLEGFCERVKVDFRWKIQHKQTMKWTKFLLKQVYKIDISLKINKKIQKKNL